MKISADLKAFSDRLGYSFARSELLLRALTHGSISTATRPDNQRLEFLGDRVLGLTMAEALFAADRTATEGQLAPRYNALVKGETCAAIAREIGLGDVLKLGRSEMLSGGRRKEALLADAMEAVLAAIYLDAGLEAARTVILRLWAERLKNVDQDARDAKTALQEWAQARGLLERIRDHATCTKRPPSAGELARRRVWSAIDCTAANVFLQRWSSSRISSWRRSRLSDSEA